MLCQFSFSNFNSYRDETTFDFQASELAEFQESLIEQDKATPLLPVSAVYGPNGSGKSNLLKALACAITIVVRPIVELKKARTENIFQQSTDTAPFAFDPACENLPTEFKLYFRIGENEYRYYIAILKDEITSESLYKKSITGKRPAMIFERENSAITLGPKIKRKTINTEVNPKMPYLSFLAINYSIPEIIEAQKWFESSIIRNYANPRVETAILLPDTKDKDSRWLGERYIASLNEMGIDINGFRYDSEQHEFYLKRTIHERDYELPFYAESAGTQKLFAALPVILIALEQGRLTIIDELDSKLHPKLLRYVVSLFTNPQINRRGAQLLFTSHDLSIMKKEVFRRDEIWFTALNKEHSSELYSLFDIRDEKNQHIPRTTAYDKQYLEGRYGADPYLRKILDWEAIQ